MEMEMVANIVLLKLTCVNYISVKLNIYVYTLIYIYTTISLEQSSSPSLGFASRSFPCIFQFPITIFSMIIIDHYGLLCLLPESQCNIRWAKYRALSLKSEALDSNFDSSIYQPCNLGQTSPAFLHKQLSLSGLSLSYGTY